MNAIRRNVEPVDPSRRSFLIGSAATGLVMGFTDPLNVLGLQTLWTLFDFEFDLRAVVQATVAIHFDRAEVHEYILAAGALDESVTLRVIEPLHDTSFSHYILS